MTDKQPSPPTQTGDGNRGQNGRFVRGNKAARGNPHARRVNRLRTELYKVVTPKDLRRVIRTLVDMAANGDGPAIRVLLDRLFGPPQIPDIETRLSRLEELLADRQRVYKANA